MDGSKVGEPLNFMTRVWNTYSPLWKVSEKVSPEKQFLIDIEWDGRPSLRTNGKGIEYSPEQRSEITRIMGEDGYFAEEVNRLMRSADGQRFRKAWKDAANKGVRFDRSEFLDLHRRLDTALRNAKRRAEVQIADFESVQEKQFINYEMDRASQLGDVERILQLQKTYGR